MSEFRSCRTCFEKSLRDNRWNMMYPYAVCGSKVSVFSKLSAHELGSNRQVRDNYRPIDACSAASCVLWGGSSA